MQLCGLKALWESKVTSLLLIRVGLGESGELCVCVSWASDPVPVLRIYNGFHLGNSLFEIELRSPIGKFILT